MVGFWMLHLFAPSLHSGLRSGDEASVSPAASSEAERRERDQQMLLPFLFSLLLSQEEATWERAPAALHCHGAHDLVRLVQPAREHLQHHPGVRL